VADLFPAHTTETAPEEVRPALAAVLKRALTDTRLEALRVFVRALVTEHGAVTEADREAFFAAGYTPRQTLKAVLGVATKVMTNYTNAVAVTPPNVEFGDAVWRRPG
jgi:alkylhydroperoxidase family enzyme